MKTLIYIIACTICFVLDIKGQDIFFDVSIDKVVKVNKIQDKKIELKILIKSKADNDTSINVVLPKTGDAIYGKDYKGNEKQTYVFSKSETTKERYYEIVIADSANVDVSFPVYIQNMKGQIMDIVTVKINKDTSKYEIGPIVFSVGAAFSIDSRRVDNNDLYTDFRFTKYDFLCKGWGIDAGVSSAVSTITEPDNTEQFYYRKYYPSIQEERQLPVTGTIDKSFRVGATAAWASPFFTPCNGVLLGLHLEYRNRNLTQTNEMKPFDSVNVFQVGDNNPFLDTIELKPSNIKKSTTITEGLFGLCFGVFYSTNKYEAFIKATIGGRVQSEKQDLLYNNVADSLNSKFFNEFKTADRYIGWGVQFRLLEKTYGIKFGGEIRGIGLLRPDMFLYIAKEFNILKLGDIFKL